MLGLDPKLLLIIIIPNVISYCSSFLLSKSLTVLMAMRSLLSRGEMSRSMDGCRRSIGVGLRYFSDGKGRVLSEEERAQETVYIQKMERERMEKLKKKAELEKAELEKAEKKTEEKVQKS